MPAAVKPDEGRLAEQVIGTFAGELDFESYRNDYQVGLREIIDAKFEGREIAEQEVEAPPKVVNLMDALRQSLDRAPPAPRRCDPTGWIEKDPNLLDNPSFWISGIFEQTVKNLEK